MVRVLPSFLLSPVLLISLPQDLDEIVPGLLEGKGDPQGGFSSFFLCKRSLFFFRLQEAIEEIKQIDPAIQELLSGFENAFHEYNDESEEEHHIDEGDEGEEPSGSGEEN